MVTKYFVVTDIKQSAMIAFGCHLLVEVSITPKQKEADVVTYSLLNRDTGEPILTAVNISTHAAARLMTGMVNSDIKQAVVWNIRSGENDE